jgi:hypothetical protein
LHYEFKFLGPSVRVETDQRGLRIRSWFIGQRIEWPSIIAAGMMAPSPLLAIPSFIFLLYAAPGYKAIASKAESMQKASTRIWIAYRPGKRMRLRCLTLPRTAESTSLIDELRSHLIDRWNDALTPGVFSLRRQFGLSNRWFWPKVLLVVFAALILLFMGLLAWATVLAVLTDIRVALLIIFIAAAWWLYKQFRTKPPV